MILSQQCWLQQNKRWCWLCGKYRLFLCYRECSRVLLFLFKTIISTPMLLRSVVSVVNLPCSYEHRRSHESVSKIMQEESMAYISVSHKLRHFAHCDESISQRSFVVILCLICIPYSMFCGSRKIGALFPLVPFFVLSGKRKASGNLSGHYHSWRYLSPIFVLELCSGCPDWMTEHHVELCQSLRPPPAPHCTGTHPLPTALRTGTPTIHPPLHCSHRKPFYGTHRFTLTLICHHDSFSCDGLVLFNSLSFKKKNHPVLLDSQPGHKRWIMAQAQMVFCILPETTCLLWMDLFSFCRNWYLSLRSQVEILQEDFTCCTVFNCHRDGESK